MRFDAEFGTSPLKVPAQNKMLTLRGAYVTAIGMSINEINERPEKITSSASPER